MQNKKKQSGLSLTEILVVIGVMAILMGVSIPAAKQLANSFESSTGTRQLINAALSNARAIAVRNQTYAGVRFQQDRDGNTYIIFIQHDKDATGFANGFRAVTGRKPMKLPEDVTVAKQSVIFSPQGKLTIHDVRVRNIDAIADGDDSSKDTIFNTEFNVNDEKAMFVQDVGGLPYSFPSEQSITIGSKREPAVSTTEYISPYTGELVMEYREQQTP
jgi:prepilin-type N-terminal cleavage/methylation domain-containing protein